MRTQTHFANSSEIHHFLIQLIQQLLSLASQDVVAGSHQPESAGQLPQDLIQQLATQPKIYNALYAFAEAVYEHSSYQCQEHVTLLENALLFKILQQGRHNFFHVPAQQTAHKPINLGDFLNPISEYSEEDQCEEDQREENSCEKNQQEKPQAQAHTPSSTDLKTHLNQDDHHVENGADRIEVLDLMNNTTLLPAEISVADTNTQQVKAPIPPLEPDNKVKKMPHFQIANARVGQDYQARIKMQYPIVQDIYIHAENLKFSTDVGIQFREDLQQFSGVPTQAGEFKIYFEYQIHEHESTWQVGEAIFIITADPRSLWQMNEPDANELYPKIHSDHQHISLKDYQLLACSQRGRSHEHAGTFRDDDFFIQHLDDSDWSILIVADGAGSAPYSRQGSYLAVQQFATHVLDYLHIHQQDLNAQLEQWQIGQADARSQQVASRLGQQFQDVFYQAAQRAVDAIAAEATQQQCAVKAFATTLLATVVKQNNNSTFVSSFWIGDGAIAIYSQDKVRLMGKPDGGEFAGQTRFLDAQVIKQFGAQVNVGYFPSCEAVILMTDGISDPRFETDAGLQNEQKWHELWQDIQPALHHSEPDVALLEWSKFFSVGHHDDRTLALLWTQAPDLNISTASAQVIEKDTFNTDINVTEHKQIVDLQDPPIHPEQGN